MPLLRPDDFESLQLVSWRVEQERIWSDYISSGSEIIENSGYGNPLLD